MSAPPQVLPPRQRILLTAHDLFYRDGVRATGIDRIISESGVAKVTFYRHFPSKNELIEAFLAYRHEQWLSWFSQSLTQYVEQFGDVLPALVPCLEEWFSDPHYRGCPPTQAANGRGARSLSAPWPEARTTGRDAGDAD